MNLEQFACSNKTLSPKDVKYGLFRLSSDKTDKKYVRENYKTFGVKLPFVVVA